MSDKRYGTAHPDYQKWRRYIRALERRSAYLHSIKSEAPPHIAEKQAIDWVIPIAKLYMYTENARAKEEGNERH